tara:strand:- start:911 stop:1021 length:111 start_codon:yes stop_codon:yes gene_type:complete
MIEILQGVVFWCAVVGFTSGVVLLAAAVAIGIIGAL